MKKYHLFQMAESLYKVKVIRITVQNGVLAQLLSCRLYNTIYYNVHTEGKEVHIYTKCLFNPVARRRGCAQTPLLMPTPLMPDKA